MRKDLPPILTSILFGALTLQSCNPFESPQKAEAAPLITNPTLPPETPTTISISTPYSTETANPTPSPIPIKTPDIPYFSQFNYQDEYFKKGVPWDEAACGIMAGAMITKTEPLNYYQRFLDYLASIGLDGKERITNLGSYTEDQVKVMESMGYRFLEIPVKDRSEDEIKSDVKRFTDQGFAILVAARIWTGDVNYPHISVAVGVNQDNEIVWNDPAFGEKYVYTLPRKIFPSRYFVAFPPVQ
jgi:hypothetical protein